MQLIDYLVVVLVIDYPVLVTDLNERTNNTWKRL